ncbi:MAG: hypothetical protein HOC23_12260 [Halieaceae bacterium]|nr:hypothetical protein [Halieaceae bacterium]
MAKSDKRLTKLDEILGRDFGFFEKTEGGRYIAMSDANRKRLGIPLDMDLSQHIVTDYDLVHADMAEEIINADKGILNTGEPVWAYTWIKNELGEWVKVFAMKQRTPGGTVLAYTFVAGQTELVGVWVRRLDYEREVLRLGGKSEKRVLSRRELQILRLFINGVSRKEMANEIDLSMKSIEKYLSNIRDKVIACCAPDEDQTLRWCLNHSGLTEFLLEKPDWFEDSHERFALVPNSSRESAP